MNRWRVANWLRYLSLLGLTSSRLDLQPLRPATPHRGRAVEPLFPMSAVPKQRRKRTPKPDRRRALELLAASRDGHIEPDHLVNLADIAARAGITRAAASHYAQGDRGKDFPAPIVRVTTESPLWDWVDVARWFHRQGRLPIEELLRARIVRQVNITIMVQERRQQVVRLGRERQIA
jgi:hypothetical protein